MQSILMIRLSAIGDVLMCVPLLRTLQAAYPHAKITWVVARPAEALIERLDGVELVIIDKPKTLKDYYQFYKRFKHQTFDVLLALQANLRANLLYPLVKAKRKIGYDPLRAKDFHGLLVKETIAPGQDHTVETFLKFGAMIGADKPVIRWDLPLDAEDKAFADNAVQDKSFLLINPASSKPERTWLAEHYIALANMAKEKWGLEVVLSGGPSLQDRTLADKIIQAAPHCIDLVGKTKPRQLLAVIQKAKIVVCPDTGPAHMAASVGTPVVSLHAATNPQVSGPYTFLQYAVNYYPEALRKILHTTEADVPFGRNIHGPEAMTLIPLEAVVERLDEILLSHRVKVKETPMFGMSKHDKRPVDVLVRESRHGRFKLCP